MSAMARQAHAPDCDGYAYVHWGQSRRVSAEGRGMWQAGCEKCGWRGTLVGPDAREVATREARAHTAEGPCEGQCRGL